MASLVRFSVEGGRRVVGHGRKPVDVGLPRLAEVTVKKERKRFPDTKLEKDSGYRLLIRKVGEKRVICSCTVSGDVAERIIAEAKKSIAPAVHRDALKQLDKVTDEFEELRKMIRQ